MYGGGIFFFFFYVRRLLRRQNIFRVPVTRARTRARVVVVVIVAISLSRILCVCTMYVFFSSRRFRKIKTISYIFLPSPIARARRVSSETVRSPSDAIQASREGSSVMTFRASKQIRMTRKTFFDVRKKNTFVLETEQSVR